IGVFCVTSTVVAALGADAFELVPLLVAVVAVLLLFAVLLTVWIRLTRDWESWSRDGLIPAIPALAIALVTASSSAAFPLVPNAPLLARDPRKRGIMDLGTTLNKSGTAAYVALSAMYLGGGSSRWQFLSIPLLSILAGTAAAGVPFAAVVGLRMVLLVIG